MTEPAPPTVMDPPGLIGDIARWIDSCAVRPCKLLSVAAALSITSTLAGRRYALKSGLRTCTYVVGIAKSGVGKDLSRKCAVSLLDRCGLRARVGTGSIASGAGLIKRLVDHPTQLFLLDEFGRLVEGFAGKNAASHEREIMTYLMELWSSADSVFIGKAYAQQEAPTIEQPHTVIYGTTTPDSFFGALKGRDVVDGVISRMLLWEVDHDRLPQVMPTGKVREPPVELIAQCKRLAAGAAREGNLAGLETSSVSANPEIISVSNEAADGYRVLAGGVDALLPGVEHRDLWVRAEEQTLRVALACAVGCGHTQIEASDMKWAWDVVRWCTKRSHKRISTTVADSDEHRCMLGYLAAIDDAGGMADRRRIRLSKHVRRFDARMIATAEKRLLDDGEMVVDSDSVSANGKHLVKFSRPLPDE